VPPRRPVAGRRLPHRLVQPAVEKSLPLALASAGGQIRSGDAALMALRQQSALRGQLAQPLPRDEYPYEFGPNIPLVPAPLDPAGLSGRAEPRLYEYPVSWNLPGQDNRLIPWRTLREAGDHPLIRAAITVRKAEIAGLEWDFTLSRRAVDEAVRDSSGASRLDVEQQLRDRLRPAIMAARAAWQKPDVGNGLTFAEWTSRFLEEHLVLDAAVIYPRLTVGGKWFSFEILDGATVKPLLDHRGGRPLPPQPAYQQILYGFPRGEFTADTSDMDGQLQIPNAYRVRPADLHPAGEPCREPVRAVCGGEVPDRPQPLDEAPGVAARRVRRGRAAGRLVHQRAGRRRVDPQPGAGVRARVQRPAPGQHGGPDAVPDAAAGDQAGRDRRPRLRREVQARV
jgi:hypothetical protein